MSTPLVLTFDVNRTILIADKAAGKDTKDELCAILASCCWGHTVTKGDKKVWEPEGNQPGERKSETSVSYYDFLRSCYPLPKKNNDASSASERSSVVETIKNKRRGLIKIFTEPGQPGHVYRPVFESLLKKLELPEGFVLLPAFYQTLIHFKKMKKPFALCFRTFGEDLPEVAKEFNKFCNGKHPSFPGVQFNTKDNDIMLNENNIGAFFRRGPSSDDCYLIMGTLAQPKVDYKGDVSKFYNEGTVKIYHGFKNIDTFMQEQFKKGVSLGLRDYYPWWASCSEHFDSGKLILIDKEDKTRARQLFFDDNIRISNYKNNGRFIVDPRRLDNGEPFKDVEGLIGDTLFHADALYAIQNENYFVDIIESLNQ